MSSDTDVSLAKMMATLEKRAKTSRETQKRVVEIESEIAADFCGGPELLQELPDESSSQASGRGLTSVKLREGAEKNLEIKEQLGLFSTYPLQPSDEFPTLLGRLPIFLPGSRKKQQTRLDQDNAYAFQSPFGKGRRFGANLTIRDEDILIALMRLRTKRLRGLPSNLPINEKDIYGRDSDGLMTVFATLCTIADIHREMRISNGGENYEETLDSIKRLSSCTIELELNKHDRYLGVLKQGKQIDLLKAEWTAFTEYQIIYVQFNPIICRWLESDFTYINWEQRRRLKSDYEKALHRFLSSQPKYYKQGLSELADTIGLDVPSNKVKHTIEKALIGLKQIDFIKEYDIKGTGRATPHVLQVWR